VISNAFQRLGELAASAFDRVEEALAKKLAEFNDADQQLTIRFYYAECRHIPATEQVTMLIAGKNSASVAEAAARQRNVPEALQFALVQHCQQHPEAMRALALNANTRPAALAPLVEHTNADVRLAVATHIGRRMLIRENELDGEKRVVFDAIIEVYEGSFAPLLVPVCKDAGQIRSMFDQTMMTPSNARLFVDNPYTPDGVLLDISNSPTPRLMPGGSEVLRDLKKLLGNRLSRADDAAAPEV